MENDETDHTNDDSEPPGEYAFTLVGNKIRAGIVQVLGDATIENLDYAELSPTELRSRLDIDVVDSQLHYHLQKLEGHFVTRGEVGYSLRPEGLHLYRAIRAGLFTKRQNQSLVKAGFACHFCQAPMTGWFDKGIIKVQCQNCEFTPHHDMSWPLSPDVFEDTADAFAQYSKHAHHKILGWARGICQTCGNAMETAFITPDERHTGGDIRYQVLVRRLCDHCGDSGYLTVGTTLLTDPELMNFCLEHGVDVLATPFWELEFAATDNHVTVRSTDPWEVALSVKFGDDELELVVDEDLTVVERNRA